ncbi:MAG: type I-A CRISPR-associated protein Cas5a [Sulfolobaceae archaeon]|nr:type I-A CRISPR-associated protein Cas5a [Sulfolobaceae archaeon]
MTLYSKVTLKLHWGFSVSYPSVSKSKPSFLLPPPSTLKGALSFGKYRGKDVINGKYSPAKEFEDMLAYARYSDDTVASYSEDVVRNLVMYFQRPERRAERRYWFNIVPTGKVISPSGKIIAVFITDQLSREELEKLSWSIVRLGSKESIVSVEEVEIGEAKPISSRVKTRYYFPASASVDPSYAPLLVYVDFWEGGYEFGKEYTPVRYAIPLQRFPIASVEVAVDAKKAYEVGGEYVVVS